MTFDDFVISATRRLNAGSPQNGWEDSALDIATCVQAAIHALAKDVMLDNEKRGLLQQTYSVTISGSTGDLLSPTGSVTATAAEILPDGIYYGVLIDADGDVLQPLKTLNAFYHPQSLVYSYYHVGPNMTLYTRSKQAQVNIPADVVGVNGPVSVVASYAPQDPADIPHSLEDDLVEYICRIAMTKSNEKYAVKG